MKEEKLFEIMEDIDEKYIDEARQTKKKGKKPIWMKWIAAAACFCVCLTGLLAVRYITPDTSTDSNTASQNAEANMEKEAKNDLSEDSESSKSSISEELQKRIQDLQSAENIADRVGWIVIENRIYMQDTSIDITKLEKDSYIGRASEFIGTYQSDNDDDGCSGDVYSIADTQDIVVVMLDNGGVVCLRTEDRTTTPYDAPVDEETYHEATSYPDDIEQLQNSISKAMGNGELPFVVTSSIMENPLRLEVSVTTKDEELLDKVRAYDPTGKYLVIIYGEDDSTEDLLMEKE